MVRDPPLRSAPLPARPEARIWAVLIAIAALSFGLRFASIDRLLPVYPEPDASLVWMYRSMAGQELPAYAAQHFGVYPVMLPHALAAISSAHALDPAPQDAPLEEHLEAASAAYLRMRVLIATISFLAAPLGFFIARRFLGQGSALFASALLATALMHVVHSSMGKPHGAHATLAWLTILCALRQLEAPSGPRILATVVAAIAAIGVLPTGYFLLAPMIAAALLSRPASRTVAWSAWLAPAAALLGGLLFLPGGVDLGSDRVTFGHGHKIFLVALNGGGLMRWPVFLWEHDPALAVLAATGLLLLPFAARRAAREPLALRRALVICAYALPFTAVISLDSFVADRYLLPLYPVLAMLAALTAQVTVDRLPGTRPKVLAYMALLALPTWIAVRYTWLGGRPDTFQQLSEWMERQPDAPAKKILLAPSISPRLFPTDDALARQSATGTGRSQPWFFYLARLPAVPTTGTHYDLGTLDPEMFVRDPPPSRDELLHYLDAEHPDWIVVEVTPRMFAFPGGPPIYDLIRHRGRLLAEFSPEGGARLQQASIDYQAADDLARRVLSATCFGPHLEVYRWRSTP